MPPNSKPDQSGRVISGYCRKVGCVLLMVTVPLLPFAEFGQNDHWEYAPHIIYPKKQNFKWYFQIISEITHDQFMNENFKMFLTSFQMQKLFLWWKILVLLLRRDYEEPEVKFIVGDNILNWWNFGWNWTNSSSRNASKPFLGLWLDEKAKAWFWLAVSMMIKSCAFQKRHKTAFSQIRSDFVCTMSRDL